MNTENIKNLILTTACRTADIVRRRPAEPDPRLWIFSSTQNRHFNYNSKYLFLYVKDHCPDITARYVINDDGLRRKLNLRYGPDPRGGAYFIETASVEGIRLVLSAGVWFTSAGLPVYGSGLSKNRLIVNLWHGVPLKTIALRDRTQSRLQKIYFKKLFSENYTHVAATSEIVSRVMSRSLGVSVEKMRIWGQPRCDCLFESFDRSAFSAGIFPDLSFRSAVLYAPTFRTGKDVRLFPFPDFDEAALNRFLEEHGTLLCIRMHIAQSDAEPIAESRNIRYLNEDKLEDIMEGLQAFDALITDYSSIYIDYLLLDRPVIFLPYDLEEYRREHGFAFPFEKVTPGPKPATQAEFLASLCAALGCSGAENGTVLKCGGAENGAVPGCGGVEDSAGAVTTEDSAGAVTTEDSADAASAENSAGAVTTEDSVGVITADEDPYARARRKIRCLFYAEAAPCSAKIVDEVRRDAGI